MDIPKILNSLAIMSDQSNYWYLITAVLSLDTVFFFSNPKLKRPTLHLKKQRGKVQVVESVDSYTIQ